MDNFNLRKYLAEGKLNENMFDVDTTEKIAQAIADAFTADDDLDLKYVVNPRIDAGHFDLDVEAGPNTPGEDSLGQDIDNYLGEFAGGSFYIKDGVVYNAAMRNAPVANVTPEGEVEMISAEESRAAIGMDDEIDMDRYNDDLDMKDDKLNPGMYIDDEEWEREMGRMEESEKEMNENKPSNKMKKSELKEMIKAAMLEDARTDAEQEGYKDGFEDAKDDIEDKLKDMKVSEAEDVDVEDNENVDVEDTENVDVDIEKDVKVDDEETEADIDVKTSVAGESEEVEAVQGLLTKALEMSQALGDEKLEDQIGNTITYFTRAHVSRVSEMNDMDVNVNTTEREAELGLEEAQSLNEVKRLQKLAGIIK